jgi:hypothetical protein
MAGEYRFNHASAEVLGAGLAATTARFNHVSAEVLGAGLAATTARFHSVFVEVLGAVPQGFFPTLLDEDISEPFVGGVDSFVEFYQPSLLDEGDQVFPASFAEVFSPATVDDSAADFAGGFPAFVVAQAPAIPYEWNPLRPDVPAGLDTDLPLYAYMREQAEILREQHDIAQAGGTTFPWELMTRLSATQQFQLGAMSRFYHERHGILLARYVRFSPRWGGGMHVPVGHDSLHPDWVVTDRLNNSHWSRLVGVSTNYESDVGGLYGWVLVQGRAPVALQVAGLSPVSMEPLTWVADGVAGYGAGKSIGFVLKSSSVRPSQTTDYELPAFEWVCDVSGVTDAHVLQVSAGALDALDDRVTAVENTLGAGLVDYQPQIDSLSSRADNLTVAIGAESRQRSMVDSSMAARINVLESAATLGVTHAEFNALDARVVTLEAGALIDTSALEASVVALSATSVSYGGRITTLESNVTGLTSLAAGLTASFGSIDSLGDVDTSTIAPSPGQLIGWDGSLWVPVNPPSGGSVLFDVIEVDVGAPARDSGSVTVGGLTGLIVGKPVVMWQALESVTGKGDLSDNAELEGVSASGIVSSATEIAVTWWAKSPVAGIVKFNYLIGG